MSDSYNQAIEFLKKNNKLVDEYKKEIQKLGIRQENLFNDLLKKLKVDSNQKPLVDYIWDAAFNDWNYNDLPQ